MINHEASHQLCVAHLAIHVNELAFECRGGVQGIRFDADALRLLRVMSSEQQTG